MRADFRTDEHRFKALNMSKRPFLREDTAFLMSHSTRVLVDLLLQAGYDATRITLFDRQLRSFLVWVNERDVSVEAFRVPVYSEDIAVAAYSYEAVPYTKLFSALGIQVRIFNLDRPSPGVSALAEQPSLLLGLLFLVSGLCRALHRVLVLEGKVRRSPRRYAS